MDEIKNKKTPIMKKVAFLLIAITFLFSCKEQAKSKQAKTVVKSTILEKIKKEKKKGHILVCSHRAYHVYAPENSLEAIKQGIEIGVDFQEIDVSTTKDSILVLMHDKTIDRTTNGKGKISNYTYQELQQFNLRIGDSLTTHKIPKLIDALMLLKKSSKSTANLDLKAVDTKQLYTMLKSLDMQHEVISFVNKLIQAFELQDMDSLYAYMPLANKYKTYEFYKKSFKSPLQHFNDRTFTPKMMDLAQKDGIYIFINALGPHDNDILKEDYRFLDSVIALKPTIIQTDYPKKLMEYLRIKGINN